MRRLDGKVALITGADSGIGRAVATLFAREGADIAISYLCEHDDAKKTKEIIEAEGRKAVVIAGDIGSKDFCDQVVKQTVDELGTPQSHGCVRQERDDAIALWEFAPIGTEVEVTA